MSGSAASSWADGPLAELAATLVSASTADSVLPLAAAGIAGAAAVAAVLPAVSRWVLPPPRETRLADHLPFESVLRDGKTIRCRDGRLVRVVEFLGIDTTALSGDERAELNLRRKRWFEDVADEGSAELKVIVTRRRTGVAMPREVPADMARMTEIGERWQGRLADTYQTRTFVVVSVRGRIELARSRLDAVYQSMTATLDVFRPVELSSAAGLLVFWSDLLNPRDVVLPFAGGGGLSDVLVASTLEFAGEAGIGTFRRGEETTLIAALGIRRWGAETSTEAIAELLAQPLELTLLHLIEPQTKMSALRRLEARRRAALSAVFDRGEEEEIAHAQGWIDSAGEEGQGLVRYQLTIFVQARDRDELDRSALTVRRALSQGAGARAVVEGASIMPLYFSLFPGTQNYIRETDMMSQNVADLVPLESPITGLTRCDWGEGPLAVFRSLSGAPYYFQFHDSAAADAPGHTLVIGPTGSGKTTLLTFLMGNAMARHPKLRAYLFDSFDGAFVFTHAFGGRYFSLDREKDAAGMRAATLNPLQMNLSEGNRDFLRRWLEMLSGCDDADSKAQFARMIDSLARLAPHQRTLSANFSTWFEAGSAAHTGLVQWVDDRQRGKVFNGVEDTLDLAGTRLVGFDMTRVFTDPELVAALLPYLIQRIRGTVAEAQAPYLIFFDETSHMLRDPRMAQFLEEELQQARKRQGVAVCAFQEPNSLWEHGDRASIVTDACKTRIFLRNPSAKIEAYERFDLGDFEWSFIKGQLRRAAHLPHAALVKRDTPLGPESVILDIGLGPLGDHMSLFRSGSNAANRAREALRVWEAGWVDHYLKEDAHG